MILAGLYDIRNIKSKIRLDEVHKTNRPWNIAADFLVDMNFSADEIADMLRDYEADFHTGMDIQEISGLLYDYTSGYPYLVSRLCKFMDEWLPGKDKFPTRCSAWTKPGFLEAVKMLLAEVNPLFQSLKGKIEEYPKLRKVLYNLLFTGRSIPYTAMNDYIEAAAMFEFIKNVDGTAVISNRIIETLLYNWFMAEEYDSSKMYDAETDY